MKCSSNDFVKTYQPTAQYKWIKQVFTERFDTLTFMDLAANHPIHQSNTYPLEQMGWKGVCIDANYECIRILKKNRSCKVLHAVVSKTKEYINFTYNGEMGGIINKKYDNSENSENRYVVMPHTLLSIVKELNLTRIDYLSLDVEGAEEDILSDEYDWSNIISTMTIERPSPRLCQLLFKTGYLYAGSFGDAAFIHKSHPKALVFSKNETFKYPVAKCRNHKHKYNNRIILNRPCKSIFGCCSFPGYPPNLYAYQ